jgi:hypothetical protein
MKSINSTAVFEESHVASKKKFVSAFDNESMECLMDHYDEPSFFFRGAVYGLIFCVPFWVAFFWIVI